MDNLDVILNLKENQDLVDSKFIGLQFVSLENSVNIK